MITFELCTLYNFQGELPFPSPQHMTPEAVAQAMKVLEIHEKLEHPDHPADTDEPADRLGNNEVEVLKEMCNVSIPCNITTYLQECYNMNLK